MTNPHMHAECPACTGHIAITDNNAVLPDLSRHDPGCWWRPGMPTPAPQQTDHFTLWEREMRETQP